MIDAITGITTTTGKGFSPTQIAKAAEAAKGFEAMFATQILTPMMESVEVDETFGGGQGEEIFRGMLLQEYGKAAAASGSLGLSAQIQTHMLQFQEAP
jgi:peptidoglycan hydrolase FlgJ